MRTKLKEVNKQLPAAVYIPFLNEKARNYAVLHIAADESRIFKTKERAPVMLTLEVYRPIELSLAPKPTFMHVNDELKEQFLASSTIDIPQTPKKKGSSFIE